MHGSASVARKCDGGRALWLAGLPGAARAALCWALAFALLLQIGALAVSPIAPAGALDSLIGAAICHSADEGAGASEPQDRLVVHFKCIACVLACSAPPPSIDAAAAVQFAWARYRPGWPLAAVLPQGASTSSHFARGPPATA
ncbi:hypothetical protein NML43_02880 [Rhodopseudomonas palustris]|uniref:DUF2946 family protein n=1 Tax=Rhodopseudomonas palustris TaxID=1076 RepID=UPI0020CC83CB|nr:DUF2946 family protein [Rhodopseudomonas palustris]MCP9626029.1 hypothetical protein [Rhodopseudomonas palustris]